MTRKQRNLLHTAKRLDVLRRGFGEEGGVVEETSDFAKQHCHGNRS